MNTHLLKIPTVQGEEDRRERCSRYQMDFISVSISALACLWSICINYLVISSFNCFLALRIILAILLCILSFNYYHLCHWSSFQSYV